MDGSLRSSNNPDVAVEERVDARAYNYAVFPPDDDVEHFARFAEHLKAGERAPDPPLVDLETLDETRLSASTREGLTIVEFGSLT